MAAAGKIAGPHVQPADRRESGGQQAALQSCGGGPVHLVVQGLDGHRGPVRRELQQVGVLAGEDARAEGPHMEHADDRPIGEQRGSHQGPDALVQQERIDHLGVIHVIDDHRVAFGRDPPGKSTAQRDPHPLPYLFFQATRRGRHQVPRPRIQQQHRGRVGLQGILHAADQRLEHGRGIKRGQRGISDRLDIAELVRPAGKLRRARRPGGSPAGVMVVCHLCAPAESVVLRHQPVLPFRAVPQPDGPVSSSPADPDPNAQHRP